MKKFKFLYGVSYVVNQFNVEIYQKIKFLNYFLSYNSLYYKEL